MMSLLIREYIKASLLEMSKVDSYVLDSIRAVIEASEFWKYDNFMSSNRTKEVSDYMGDRIQTAAASKMEKSLLNLRYPFISIKKLNVFFVVVSIARDISPGWEDWAIGANFNPPVVQKANVFDGRITIKLGTFSEIRPRDREAYHQEIIDETNMSTVIDGIMDSVEHELVHLYQWKDRVAGKVVSGHKRRKREDGSDMDLYLSDPDEIDAYARDAARDLLRYHGKEKALDILRNTVNKKEMSLGDWRAPWKGILPQAMVNYLQLDTEILGFDKEPEPGTWEYGEYKELQKRSANRLKVWKRFLRRTYQYIMEFTK